MKKYLILFILVPLFGCVNNQGTSREQMQQKNDSLNVVISQKDSIIDDIFVSLNAVAENLNTIKTRENLINKNMTEGEMPKSTTTQISEDIEAINTLLLQNRETIARLEQNAELLRKANVKIGSLEKLIAQMTTQIESQDQEIKVLKQNLADKNVQVQTLTEEVTGLNTQVTELSTEKASLEGEIKNRDNILNTGYYIIGSEKELLSKEIVYKSGFIGRTLKINENRSLDSFTQVDIRNLDHVMIGQKKATLVSSHPAESYEFVMAEDGTFESLQIKDKNKFWEYSKVMVISYK